MKLHFNCTIDIDIMSPKLKDICKNFTQIIKILLQEFFSQVITAFADEYMNQSVKPFSCDICNNNTQFKWKTHHGKATSIVTIFGTLNLFQLQIECKTCKHRMYITRKLLNIAPRKRIPLETVRRLGLIGSLTTYRVAHKIVGMFGIVLDKMTIWRAVQKLGEDITFDLDPDELGSGEADGTGVPIKGIKKRGMEMKVFLQLKKSGGVHIAGLSIGKYDGGWNKLFAPLIPSLNMFKEFLLVTDGDTSILKGLENKVKIIYQRCLWHIPHQFKWYLWKDGVKRKSDNWCYALAELISISQVKYLQHDTECIADIVKSRNENLDKLIKFCKKMNYKHCASYLKNAQPDMFTAMSKKLEGKTTSRVERVMKTINMRINVGKWSPTGALNVNKIRLAYYYNNFDVE